MKRKTTQILGLVLLLCGACAPERHAEVWVTSGDGEKKLSREPDIRIEKSARGEEPASDIPVKVDLQTRYQQMIGFGGAICDNSAYVFDNYVADRDLGPLFEHLFGESGIRLNYLRMIMGSTDNSLEWYTYDDMPAGETDEAMAHFSMERDEEDVIPYFQLAREFNPDLKVLGSPCSPPAWMKDSKQLFSGSVERRYYPALARYFVRYVETMEQRYGLDVEAITIQNEPLYEQFVPEPRYPNMLMTAEEQRDFIRDHLGPAFGQHQIDTKILCFDHNWDLYDYANTILDDSLANRYVDGIGFHCYGGTPELMKNVYERHPDKEIYHTECSLGGWGAQDLPGIMEWLVGDVFIGNIENFTSTVLLWYLSTDEHSGPVTNGCPSCRGFVTVDSKSGAITYNPEYYLCGHFSKFVDPGARRVAVTLPRDTGLRSVAFRNPDGSCAAVLLNTGNEQHVTVHCGEDRIRCRIPAMATVTLKW